MQRSKTCQSDQGRQPDLVVKVTAVYETGCVDTKRGLTEFEAEKIHQVYSVVQQMLGSVLWFVRRGSDMTLSTSRWYARNLKRIRRGFQMLHVHVPHPSAPQRVARTCQVALPTIANVSAACPVCPVQSGGQSSGKVKARRDVGRWSAFPTRDEICATRTLESSPMLLRQYRSEPG